MVAKVPVDPILHRIREAAAKKLLDMYGSVVGYNNQTYTINVGSNGMPLLDESGQVSVTNTATGSKTVLPTENLVFQDPSAIRYTNASGATQTFTGTNPSTTPVAPAGGGVMNMIQTGTGIGGTIGQLKTGFGNKNVPNTAGSSSHLPGDAPTLSNAWDHNSTTTATDNSAAAFRTNLNNLNENYQPGFTQQQFNSKYGSSADPLKSFTSDATTHFQTITDNYNSTLNNEIQRLQAQQTLIKNQLSQFNDDGGAPVSDIRRDQLEINLKEVNHQLTDKWSERLVKNPAELQKIQDTNIANAREAFGPAHASWQEYTQLQERRNAFQQAIRGVTDRDQVANQINQITGHTQGTSALLDPTMNGTGPRVVSPEFSREYARAKFEAGLTGRDDASLTTQERNSISGRITQNRQEGLKNIDFTRADYDQAQQDLVNDGITKPTEAQIAQRQYENAIHHQLDEANQHFINDKVHDIKMGVAYKGALAAGAAYGLTKSFESMWNWDSNSTKTDKFKSIAGALGSFATMAVTMHAIHSALNNMSGLLNHHITGLTNHLANNWLTNHLTSGVGIGATTVGLFVVSYLMRNKKSDEEIALEDLNNTIAPVVGYDGPVMLLTAGLALAGMGINLSPTAPLMQTRPVTQLQLDKTLGTGIENRYGTLFVQNGTNGQPTRVMYLTPGGVDAQGNVIDQVHVTTLGKGLTFGNPGSGAYIPFFTKDSSGRNIPNPQATACLEFQAAMVRCSVSGKVTTMTGMQCAAQGGTCSHAGLTGS